MTRDITIRFSSPIAGYWDGGAKFSGTFTCQIVRGGYEGRPALDHHFKWGCWEFNFWFRLPPSKSPERAARAYLTRKIRPPQGVTFELTVIEPREVA